MKKVLWLCSWYPSEADRFIGDFIQRQAIACAKQAEITVLHVCITKTKVSQQESSTHHRNVHLAEYLSYVSSSNLPIIGKVVDSFRYFIRHHRFLQQYIQQHGKPALIHVQIPMKAGLFALWAKWRWKIPYVLTEHYGIYNEASSDHFYTRSFAFRYGTRLIVKHADAITTVSKSLGDEMNERLGPFPFHIIPNVVDTSIFRYQASKAQKNVFRFLHVSNMIPLKNVSGMIEAISRLREQRQDFELQLVGGLVDDYIRLAREKNLLNTFIYFKGEVPYEEIATEMKNADALLIFSDTESQSCVVLESLCIGRPAIVTNVGGVKELINDQNGLKVEVRHIDDLVDKMNTMMDDYSRFNQEEISANAIATYAYDEVGKRFNQVYEALLQK